MSQRKANFHGGMLPLARAVRAEFGIPVSFALAQAANESAYGLATWVSARNFYGIKCVDGPVGPAGIAIGCTDGRTTEAFDGRRVRLTASFPKYRTALDSMRDMGSLLKRKHPGAMAVRAPGRVRPQGPAGRLRDGPGVRRHDHRDHAGEQAVPVRPLNAGRGRHDAGPALLLA
ncbi:MAG: Flagellar protein FlgJ [Solirubrobacterales bacterium]|nr:Flagellar protein FlgJ [Solirubrobacterales bacterium]